MRHVRMLGVCLAAVFAVAAIASASASALPEWGQCFKKGPGGKYTDSNCTKKSSLKSPGEFEFRKGPEIVNKKFSGEGGVGVLEGLYRGCEPGFVRQPNCNAGETEILALGKPLKVECETEINHGELAGTKEVKNISVKFEGCKALGTVPCGNGKEGEVIVNPLKGKLGYLKKAAPKEVGVLLEPTKIRGEFAKFACAGFIGTVVGVGNAKEGCGYPLPACGGDGIISPITPINQMTSKFTQVFTVNEETAENIPNKFEGSSPLKVLESYIYDIEEPVKSYKWSKAGETITNVNTGEEEGEIKA